MDSYSEVRRVRQQMSETAGHDVRVLIAEINKRRHLVAARLIDPGTAEHDAAPATDERVFTEVGTSSAAG